MANDEMNRSDPNRLSNCTETVERNVIESNSLNPTHVVSNNPGETGWYAVDQEHRRVLGPYGSEKECSDAISERGDKVPKGGAVGGIAASG